MEDHQYFVYIITNPGKTVLYIRVTNDLSLQIQQHYANRGKPETFAGRYHCYKLLYFEEYYRRGNCTGKEIKKYIKKKERGSYRDAKSCLEFFGNLTRSFATLQDDRQR